MKPITVELTVDPRYQKSTVTITTPDEELGSELAAHVRNFVSNQQELILKADDSYFFLKQSEIIYVEVLAKELTIFCEQETYRLHQTLKKILEQLNANFIQVSKSTVINTKKIKRLEVAFSGNYYAYLVPKQKIVISRRYMPELKKKINLQIRSEQHENIH